jgi:hypothetical protein
VKVWGLSEEQLHEAMYRAGTVYPGLIFNRAPEKQGRAYRLTLRMVSSDAMGAKMSEPRNIYGELVGTPRKTVSADWDVHGTYMAAVFSINPNARIQTAQADLRGVDEFFAHYPVGRLDYHHFTGDPSDSPFDVPYAPGGDA